MSSAETVPTTEVVHLDGVGRGVIDPSDQCSDEEFRVSAIRNQEPVAEAAIVCMDERHSANGTKEPVRRKTGGGAAMTGMMGMVYGDASTLGALESQDTEALSQGRANEVFNFAAEMLDRNGVMLGGHVATNAPKGKTGCGGKDAVEAANDLLVKEPKVVQSGMELMMAGAFAQEHFDFNVIQARKVQETNFFSKWDPVAAIAKERELKAAIEELDDTDVVREDDPENKRHGHGAEGIVKNTKRSKSNNRDNSDKRFFQLDESAIDEVGTQLHPRNELEAQRILHGEYAYNVALAIVLTKNQRVLVI